MAYKKQLRDKDGNVVYPDVGLNLDDAVYSDDPTEVVEDIIDPSSYSLDEKWTGGYWIDGRKIYKKTINFGALPNNNNKGVNLNISNLGMVIGTEAFCVYSNGVNFPIPFTNLNDFNSSVMLNYTSAQVVITTKSDRSGATGYITIYYTKTS